MQPGLRRAPMFRFIFPFADGTVWNVALGGKDLG